MTYYNHPGMSPQPTPPQPTRVDVGETLSAAWRLFTANWAPWVLITLILGAITLAIGFVNPSPYVVDSAGQLVENEVNVGLQLLVNLVLFVIGVAFQVMMIRAALAEVDHRKPSLGEFFTFPAFATALLASFLVTLATMVGVIFLIIGAFIVSFFFYWTLFFVVDRGTGPIESMTSSAKAIASQIGPLFLLALVCTAISIGGALLCGLGLLVAVPFVMLANAVAFRTVTGTVHAGPQYGGVPDPGYPTI